MNVRFTPEEMKKVNLTSLKFKDGSGYVGSFTAYHEIHCVVGCLSPQPLNGIIIAIIALGPKMDASRTLLAVSRGRSAQGAESTHRYVKRNTILVTVYCGLANYSTP